MSGESTNFGGTKNWIFLKKVLSLQIIFEKQRVSQTVAEYIKIVMSIEIRIEKIIKKLIVIQMTFTRL